MAAARRRPAPAPLLTVADGVARLTLPRPRIDQALAQALCAAAEQIAFDESVGVVVVQGRGHSCTGVDGGGEWQAHHDWVAAIGGLTAPVVAVIAGDAVAEGAELALACDLRIASSRARLSFPHIAERRLPRHGATQRLPRAVGRMRALDLLLSGRQVGAAEAARIGLVSHVVPPNRLNAVADDVVATLRAKGPIALRLGKEAVRNGSELTLEQGIRLEQDLYVLLQTTADRAEGVQAFRDRRPPKFRGR
jgi:enoyl-CoA hydratase/carnithine racemase